MALTDSISDMLIRIKNAFRVEAEYIDLPASKLKIDMVKILKEEGYVKNYSTLSRGVKQVLRIELKYDDNGISVIKEIKRVSKPSRRVYYKKKDIPMVLSGYGIGIFSTPKGVMTAKSARLANLGGEFLCLVY